MNRTEHLLACLAEESAEVAHRIGKALRFGLGEVQSGQDLTNAQRITEELIDLMAVAQMLVQEGLLPDPAVDVEDAMQEKRIKVERWMRHAHQQGALQGVGA